MGVVREWLGVRASRAHTISRDRSFPEPWYVGEKERLWLRAEVVAWFEANRAARAAELDATEPGWRGENGKVN